MLKDVQYNYVQGVMLKDVQYNYVYDVTCWKMYSTIMYRVWHVDRCTVQLCIRCDMLKDVQYNYV